MVELQSLWIELGFSTADLVADDHAWDLMGQVAKLFPRKDNPAIAGFDLELLQTDLIQIEQLFLTQDRSEIYAYKVEDALVVNFYIDVFKGCRILEFCRFEPRMVVQDGHQLWQDRKAKAEEAATATAKAEAAQAEQPPEKPAAEVAEISSGKSRRKAS